MAMAMAERLMGSWGSFRIVKCSIEFKDRVGLRSVGAIQIPGVSSLQCGWANQRERRRAGKVQCAQQAPETDEISVYRDSFLEIIAMEYLTTQIAHVGGVRTNLRGYDGFVDVSRKLVQGLPAKSQRDVVGDVLQATVPAWVLVVSRNVPKTKRVKEIFARVTAVFFAWLVGSCDIRETEIDGESVKSVVYIKKCRYLENSKCVGLCVNLCKNPTENFIGNQLGMPLTMNPNFEDMSCEMIYGLKPLPLDEDAAYQRSCYSLCQSAKSKPNCASLREPNGHVAQ